MHWLMGHERLSLFRYDRLVWAQKRLEMSMGERGRNLFQPTCFLSPIQVRHPSHVFVAPSVLARFLWLWRWVAFISV